MERNKQKIFADLILQEYEQLTDLRRVPSSVAFETLPASLCAYETIENQDKNTMGLALMCDLMRAGLETDMSTLEIDCLSAGVVSLVDYNALYASLSLSYSNLKPADIIAKTKKLKAFWRYVLRSPCVPNHVNDLCVCFYCLIQDLRLKQINNFAAELKQKSCYHFHTKAVANNQTDNQDLSTQASKQPTETSKECVDDRIKTDSAVSKWQSTGDDESLVSRCRGDEVRRAKLKDSTGADLRTQLETADSDVMESVCNKTRELKHRSRLEELKVQEQKLQQMIEELGVPRFFILYPFIKLHELLFYTKLSASTEQYFITSESPCEIGPNSVERLRDRLSTTDLLHVRAQIINSFYDFAVPPSLACSPYYSKVGARFAFDDLMFGAECSSETASEVRKYLKNVNLNKLCGKDAPAVGGPFQILLWSIVNIFAYCVINNSGVLTWSRGDAENGKNTRSFVHLYGGRWGIRYKCSDASKTKCWLATSDKLFKSLAAHMELVAMYGGGFF
ncbi:ORF88-like protein [Bufonid herpesvirus 1]|uniref:ORF88-like protein n=1 Tax=Bufonid herpesvirus 1 TaxID=2282206 RepID=UPI000EB6966A|nr:ORF88-like protein [Bufonid herpesvirus 1]AXF48543.1 ORF88-like protein [Bufonid herpesvirus 1]